MNKKLIRKMQTAAGGPLRLKFTPEQIAYFESQGLPLGMNNSGGLRLRTEGTQAQLYQELEKKRKEEEIKSRMEMHPTLKRKATTIEKLRGKKDEYVQTPQVIGMSGADPLFSFYVGGVGLNGIGTLAKTGLWNVAKYMPRTLLGNWGRGYFVGNTFKNSFNGNVPTITSQATSLLYQPAKLNETGLTSLKFFERNPSRISLAERMGIPKGDRVNLNTFLKQGLEDLLLYINSGQYRLKPTINMNTAEPSWGGYGNPPAILLLIADGVPSVRGRGREWAWNRPSGGTYELTTDGNGNFGIGYNSYRMFDIAPEFNVRIGEASAGSGRNGYSKIFLTAPRNDVMHFITETPELELAKKTLIETLSPRISKDIMRDFWSGVLLSLRPGVYLSGDEGTLPKGALLIRLFKELSKKAYKRDNNGNILGSGRTNWEDIRNSLMRPEKWKKRENGLSTDSYLALLKLANRENSPYSLRYSSDGFTTFNNQSIDNKFISDLLEKTKKGLATQLEFLDVFHNWVNPYGGMDARIVNGEIVIPHPFLYKKKKGGKMNILEFLKNGGQVRKMQTAAGGPIKRLKDGYRYIPDEHGGWTRISDNSMADVFATYVVKGKDKRADVRIDKKSKNFDRKFKYDETEIPFIKDKEITLTNAGLYTGAKLSTNLLDSIAKYAKASGLPLKTAVGLVAKETSLGNPTVDSSLKKLSGDGFAYQLAKALNGGLHINEGKALNPKDLINFHYEELNPYLGLKNIAYKKSVGNMDDYGREGPFGDEDFLKRYRELLKLGENYSDSLAKKLLSNFNPNKNVLQAGFEFYKLNPRKYNYNQTNYPQLVEERGNMVYNSPEFKSWLSTSEYKKQGGKMNAIEQYKQGSKIHIKEKNKGKFTSYCGGKVTDECILKGKNSSNPAIRKRATFADNARHFKHLNGGIIKAQQGTKTTTGLNSDLGLAIVNGVMNLSQAEILNELMNAQSDVSKARNKFQWDQVAKYLLEQSRKRTNDRYLRWISDYLSGFLIDHPSYPVAQHMGYLLLNLDLAEGKDDLDYQNSLIDYQTRLKTAQNWGNAIEGVLQEGLKSLSSYLNNKTSTNSSTTNSYTTSSPTTNSFLITPSLTSSTTKSFWNNSSLT